MSLQTPGPVPLAKRRDDEVSVGSTPLAKQPSNQASDYASSPVKTKTVTGMLTNHNLHHMYDTEDTVSYYKRQNLHFTQQRGFHASEQCGPAVQ